MSKVTIELNSKGVRELLLSDEMMGLLSEKANEALASLGKGYEVNTFVGRNRVNAEIAAVSESARRDNLENNSILKALR